MSKVVPLHHPLKIQDWTLHPYERFGPIPLVDLDRKKLTEILGEPSTVFEGTAAGAGDRLMFESEEGALLAWTREDKNEIGSLLFFPVGFCVQLGESSAVVPMLPQENEEVESWLYAHDVLTRGREPGDLGHTIAPLLGMLWDPKGKLFCIYPACMKVHLLLPENYRATSFEFLGDPEFVAQLKLLKKAYPSLFVPSWSPIQLKKDQEGEGLPNCQYGGVPLLQPGEKAPRCAICDAVMPLNLQIDLAQIPAAEQKRYGSEGVFQMFFCRKEECQYQGYSEGGDGKLPYLCRIVPPKDLKTCEKFRALPYRPIVGWYFEEFDGSDLDTVEATIDPKKFEMDPDSDFADLYVGCFPYCSDKLGGLPSWQVREGIDTFPENLRCPECKPSENQMQFFYQYKSDKKNRFEFGDAGQLLIFQCAKHRGILRTYMESC